MPLQNRVTPFNAIVAVAERGMFMGNRGCLHDAERRLRRQVCSERRWIICRTSFRERKRTPMTPGNYTELFFLDEATALAAGHRPCAECRNADYRRFKTAWMAGNGAADSATELSATEIDRRLHRDRTADGGGQRLWIATCGELPDGVLVTLPEASTTAFLLWNGRRRRWSPGGYDSVCPIDLAASVRVLTPKSTIRALQAGYAPVVHPSAEC